MTVWSETSSGQQAQTSVGVGGNVGAAVASAASITITEFVTEITGSTTITTLNGLVSGRIYILIPAAGASWSLGTGGNIAQAAYADDGVPMFIVKHGSTVRVVSVGVGSLMGLNVRDFGARGDGIVDDTQAFINAIAAVPIGGELYIPPGYYNITAQLTVNRAMRIFGSTAGAANGSLVTTIKHNFDGDLFVFNGTGGSQYGAGGGVENLLLLHTYSSGSGSTGYGSAIKITGTTATSRAYWIHIRNVNIEPDGSHGRWTWGINIAGENMATDYIRNVWISGGRINAAGTGGGGIRISKAANCFLSQLEATTAGNRIYITGPSNTAADKSSTIFLSNVYGDALECDNATQIHTMGHRFNTITTTTDTTGFVMGPGFVGALPSIGAINGTNAARRFPPVCTSAPTTWNPPNLAADGDSTATTVGVPGAVVGDTVVVGMTTVNVPGAILTGVVSSTNNVIVTLLNKTGAALDIAPGTVNVDVFKRF